ncbi:hypothetical protein LMG28727_03089 [Paraburkholderia kirstenboschensis]|uniref:contractile injection system protein, VgrG/Pvc8 family n=1 Tax=Paraburkholderia kirstenboschensis TaxID=1245436 RepID=UPI000A6459C1|nr:contractile injection system protein, VgrG/Pvc8 family [Paraburkholderia kirstenboschensis]CAD6533560.1 hypothetical protein LMG28727_03089 [Paraburkholderia kirstenboschensis]
MLIAHRIGIREGLCSGIVGHVTCLSTRADLPLNAFIGLPLSVQMVTHRGALHPICAIVTDARAGQSGGSLATYQLTLRDALSVLEGRTNTRICRTLSVPDVIEKLLGEWQKKSPALARAFDFDLSSLDRANFPVRETPLQFHESDWDFIRRLCRRVWLRGSRRRASGARSHRPTTPVNRRCTRGCSDRPMKLPQSSAGNAWRCMGSIPGGAAH